MRPMFMGLPYSQVITWVSGREVLLNDSAK